MKTHRLLFAAALFLAPPLQAQTGKLYRVGFLSPGDFGPGTNPGRLTEEIARHLAQNGFIAGANLELVKRGAEGHFERLPSLVAELVATKVDVIVTYSYPVAAAAKQGTNTIPTVIFGAGDPMRRSSSRASTDQAATSPAFPTWPPSSRRSALRY
jgi:putative ABC transport system substrate-binding protein